MMCESVKRVNETISAKQRNTLNISTIRNFPCPA